MKSILNYLGSISGLAGALMCAASGLSRIAGGYYIAGYEVTTLFSLGTGLMVFACLMKLEALQLKNGQP